MVNETVNHTCNSSLSWNKVVDHIPLPNWITCGPIVLAFSACRQSNTRIDLQMSFSIQVISYDVKRKKNTACNGDNICQENHLLSVASDDLFLCNYCLCSNSNLQSYQHLTQDELKLQTTKKGKKNKNQPPLAPDMLNCQSKRFLPLSFLLPKSPVKPALKLHVNSKERVLSWRLYLKKGLMIISKTKLHSSVYQLW